MSVSGSDTSSSNICFLSEISWALLGQCWLVLLVGEKFHAIPVNREDTDHLELRSGRVYAPLTHTQVCLLACLNTGTAGLLDRKAIAVAIRPERQVFPNPLVLEIIRPSKFACPYLMKPLVLTRRSFPCEV